MKENTATTNFLEYRKLYCLVSLHCYESCGSSTLYHFRPWLQYLNHQLVGKSSNRNGMICEYLCENVNRRMMVVV